MWMFTVEMNANKSRGWFETERKNEEEIFHVSWLSDLVILNSSMYHSNAGWTKKQKSEDNHDRSGEIYSEKDSTSNDFVYLH